MIVAANLFKEIMLYLNTRPGAVFPDPVHALFPSIALHTPIFIITYLPIVLGLVLVFPKPEERNDLIYAYSLLQVFRLASIYLIPLEPPPDMIILKDPVADHLVFGTVVTKDLFFSGHVSTLSLFAFLMKDKPWKLVFAALAVTDAFLLTAQHVHYSIDVLAAPFFAYAAYRLRVYLKARKIFRHS